MILEAMCYGYGGQAEEELLFQLEVPYVVVR